MAFLCLCIPAAAASLPPLPRTPAAAASQAANAAMSALQASKDPLRLQIQLYGETVEESGPLPVLSLCTRLVEVLSAHERWNQQQHGVSARVVSPSIRPTESCR